MSNNKIVGLILLQVMIPLALCLLLLGVKCLLKNHMLEFYFLAPKNAQMDLLAIGN
jgi:hypothetical protein